jgi:hypothetical protein
MASWNEVAQAAPELAESVRARFETTGLGLLATLRKDGFPRITGIEPSFALGEVWLGMMDNSLKARDLQRDPRLALHAATVDKEVKEGDARITGRGVELPEGDERREAFLDYLRAKGEWTPGGPFHLFRVDVTELVMLRPGGDVLVIESWSEDKGLRRVERH